MKDILIKSKTTLIWIGLLAYITWLMMWSLNVAYNEDPTLSVVLLVLCGLIGLYLLAIAANPRLVPDNRYSIAILWVWIIFVSHLYLQDDPSVDVYLRDIMKIIGVLLVIAWPMKLLISKKVQEKRAEENVEIIEV